MATAAEALKAGNIGGALGIDKFNIGFGSTFLNVIFVVIIAFIIIGLIGVLIVLWINKKRYKFTIPLYAKVGNRTTRIATLKAREVPMGRAGDKLWFAKGTGVKKWMSPATIQSAKNEFWHYVREDGEWVNFEMEDLDEISKKAGVKYVAQPMRLQRLATDRLLEQRLMQKGFLEKWGLVIGYVIFFLVITIALVVFFHQYGKATNTLGEILQKADSILEKANRIENGGSDQTGLIPATANSILPLLYFTLNKRKRKVDSTLYTEAGWHS